MSRGVTMRTPERLELARELRENGLTLRKTADVLGIAFGTLKAWIYDPDGAALKERKAGYCGICVDCGAKTSGSEGRRDDPRCRPCAAVRTGEKAKIWTADDVVLAIQEWAAEHNEEPPCITDWGAWRARAMNDHERAARYEDDLAAGRCPNFKSVVEVFGSWNAGITAAGFQPRAAHGGAGNQLRRRSKRPQVGV